jgi:hypothetical protein
VLPCLKQALLMKRKQDHKVFMFPQRFCLLSSLVVLPIAPCLKGPSKQACLCDLCCSLRCSSKQLPCRPFGMHVRCHTGQHQSLPAYPETCDRPADPQHRTSMAQCVVLHTNVHSTSCKDVHHGTSDCMESDCENGQPRSMLWQRR